MAGISSKAAGGVENKKKYNGIEFENDLDLNNLSAQLRDLDPQTGKWWQIDPLIEKMEMWSPYVSNYDNPIRYADPRGDEPDGGCCKDLWEGVRGVADDVMISGSGILWGGLNTITAGLVSTDPFSVRERLNKEEQKMFDNSVSLGQIFPLLNRGGRSSSKAGFLELVPAGGGPKIVMETLVIPNVIVPRVKSNSNQQNGGGKNSKHSNQKARDAAQERYENAKQEYQELKSKPNKTKEDNQALNTSQKAMKREKQRMDNTGENHSQKAKGSN